MTCTNDTWHVLTCYNAAISMHVSSEPPEGNGEAASFSKEEVEAELARILASAEFSSADQLKKLLSYVVHRKLAAPEKQISEYDAAYDVFEKVDTFSPATDSIVRNTTARLRRRLEEYYANSGKADSLIIEVPKRSYEPLFKRRVLASPPPMVPAPAKASFPRRRSVLLKCLAGGALLSLVVLLSYYLHAHSVHAPAPVPSNVIPARIFASSTSEGQKLRVIGGPQQYDRLLITPDGRKLYAISTSDEQSVTVFRAATDLKAEHVFRLASPIRSAFMSRDGARIYFGSLLEGVTVVNTATDRLERTIHTGAPVYGLAVSPDSRKLFVALGNSRLARISLETLDERILSSVALPYDMGLDGSGRNLYVAYQHGGPGGRWGHDVAEVYDTGTESVSYVIKDLPMVGAKPRFAPGNDVVLLNMADACLSPYYDHVGCPGTPSGGFYLWNPAERRVIATVALPKDSEVGGFLPGGTRLLFVDNDLAVWDWSRQQTLEKMRLPEAGSEGDIASSPGRVFLCRKEGGIFVFELERPRCQPPALGLANFYSGDGTLDDVEGTGKLTTRGKARFSAGRVGQAFDFDGRSAPMATNIAADFCPFCRSSWTEAFFVKFSSSTDEMVIMESPAGPYNAGRRILKTNDNHIVLETGGGANPRATLRSNTSIEAGRWYHVAIVTKDTRKSLFINGALQDEQVVPVATSHGDHGPVIFGADQHGHHPLHGLLDEILVYSRALTPAEVKSIATSCTVP